MESTTLPWWLHKLLSRYMPEYMIQLLEQPWILTWTAGAFLIIKFLTISYLVYRIMKERAKRKQLEREHKLLTERYEQLKVVHMQHQTMTTILLSNQHPINHTSKFEKTDPAPSHQAQQ